MYHISEQQIDYILNDIRARGIEMESLQQNLLDHICCIIEKDLEENGDFECFYLATIKTFYKDVLWEIEEETISLLMFKNYYTMKKVMIISGTFSAAVMTLGILFKFMYWPGAGALIVIGIITSSLIFSPLLFTLKAKEQQSKKDKLIVGLGTISGSLMSLSILFRIMHWPYAINLGIIALSILGFIFLPIYFFTGIRNPEKKVNVIAMSIMIIIGSGLWLTLIRSPRATKQQNVRDTYSFIRSEQILETERRLVINIVRKDTIHTDVFEYGQKINQLCIDLKTFVLEKEIGHKTIDDNFESKQVFLEDHSGYSSFFENETVYKNLTKLLNSVEAYNNLIKEDKEYNQIPTKSTFLEHFKTREFSLVTTLNVLQQLNQIQMYVLQNQALISQ